MSAETLVRSGPAHVLDHGMVTAFMGHPLVVEVHTPVRADLTFEFVHDPARDDVAVEVVTTGAGLVFRCTNFDSADGRGSAVPVLVGEAAERLIFLHFRVFRFGRTDDRTVAYTLYEVRKGDVGWEPR